MSANGVGPKTLSASGDTLELYTLLAAGSVVVHVQSSSSLVVTIFGSQDGDEWVSLPCRFLDLATGAAGASISLTTDDVLYIPAEGFGIIKLTYVSGTGSVSMRTSKVGYGSAGTVSNTSSFAGVTATNANGNNIAVSTTALRVFGASSWTGATGNTAGRAGVLLGNNSADYDLIYYLTNAGASSPSPASDKGFYLPPKSHVDLPITDGVDIWVVRASVSTDKATAEEYL